jgi:hypothetical protein
MLATRWKSIEPTGPVRAGLLAAAAQPERL